MFRLTRRQFFAALFAPFLARFLPKPKAAPLPLFGVPFDWAQVEASLDPDSFARKYIQPAMEALARQISTDVESMYRSAPLRVRFDPARLPT
jgi:hypothetical protein